MVWALDQFLELRKASDYMCAGRKILTKTMVEVTFGFAEEKIGHVI